MDGDKVRVLDNECALWNKEIFVRANQMVVHRKHNRSLDNSRIPLGETLCFPHTLAQFPIDTWEMWGICIQQITQKLTTSTSLSKEEVYEILHPETRPMQLITIHCDNWLCKEFHCADLVGMEKLVYNRYMIQDKGLGLASSLLSFDLDDVHRLPNIISVLYPTPATTYKRKEQHHKCNVGIKWDLQTPYETLYL